jgi:hypothetical protein
MPHKYNGIHSYIPIEELKNADIFIYQPMSIRRGLYNTCREDGIIKYLKSDCKIISFPSLYADIFPIYKEGQYDGNNTITKYKGLCNIKKLLDDGISKDEIIEMYKKGDLYFQLKERFLYCMEFMKEKEKECDIKASNFIEKNIKNLRLFDTQNHPTEILLGYITNEIFKILNIDFQIDLKNLPRNIINGEIGRFSFEDSFYMKKELGLNYIFEFYEDNYLNILNDYLNNPNDFLLRGIKLEK